MLINLSKSIPLKELCRITAVGHAAEPAEWIEFILSHEAMVGFATELLWMYEDIKDDKKLILTTHQLKTDPAPNQAIGFYLTPDSPVFALKVNSLTEKNESEYENWKEIRIRTKDTNRYYNVKEPFNEEPEFITLESYELSRKNIMKINVFNEESTDITKEYSTVIFEINRAGIKDFAAMLLVWADNYREGDEYVLPHIDRTACGYNLGVILSHNNIPVKFKCGDLGTTGDYDSRI